MVGSAPRVREVFDLTRLSDVIPSASDIPTGMAILHRGETATGATS